jgi:mono/diheme cytochrome c family protein
MGTRIKRTLQALAGVLALAVLSVGGFVCVQARAFDASMARVYDVPVPTIARSSDPAVIARGKHLAESLGACTLCHGQNLGGGRVEPMGPMGTIVIPNITTGKDGRGNLYTDGELARLIEHGIRRDGTSVRLMPSTDWTWWPEEDVVALVSFLRAQPPVDGDPGVVELTTMAKVLDRVDSIPIDVARRIDHAAQHAPPSPSPDAKYGAFVGTPCRGCHGPGLSGGPIPGAPPGMAVPLNLTPHETGLKGWTYEDFESVAREGKRRNGKPVDPFMPLEPIRNMNDVERRALWAYLQSAPPRPFGQR